MNYKKKNLIIKKFKDVFLDEIIFEGLIDRNNGFDCTPNKYFNQTDFEKVIKRCKLYKLQIFGINVVTNNGIAYDVKIKEDFESEPIWYEAAFNHFKHNCRKEILYNASYGVPELNSINFRSEL
tara:strand:+ start:54 stop:425 length:372 start_codon:yes stop_codon:yes gene_type:complete